LRDYKSDLSEFCPLEHQCKLNITDKLVNPFSFLQKWIYVEIGLSSTISIYADSPFFKLLAKQLPKKEMWIPFDVHTAGIADLADNLT